jgi:hypothetical protein
LKQVEILDEDKKVAEIGDLDIMLNLARIWKRKIKIERLVIRDAYFISMVDSLGNTARILRARHRSGDSLHQALILECKDIKVLSSQVVFGNAVKSNRTLIRIDDSRINLQTTDSTIVLTGHLNGQIDSLISNNTVLFSGQPIKAEEVILAINRVNGAKELLQGRLLAHTLVLIPRVRLEPHDDGNLIDLSISGEGDFNTFLDLFEFHLDLDLEQVNEDARLVLSYNQHGFVNPFLRPYSELDFEISGARFESQDLPFPVEIEQLKGNYNNGVAHSPETVELQIDTIRAFVQESFVGGHFHLSNLKDPLIDAHILARLDMAHILKGNQSMQLTGEIDLDVYINGKISELRQMHLEGRQQARGQINIRELKLLMNEQDFSLELTSGATQLNNHILEVSTLVGAMNNSPFHFDGVLENLDRYLMNENEDLNGSFSISFDELDVSKFKARRTNDEKAARSFSLPFSTSAINLHITGKRVVTGYGDLENIVIRCNLANNKFSLEELDFDYQQGKVTGSGDLTVSDKGLENVNLFLDGDFESIHIHVPASKSNEFSTGKKTFHFPDFIHARVNILARKGSVNDYPFEDLDLKASLDGLDIKLDMLRVKAFDGMAKLNGMARIEKEGISGLVLKGSLDMNVVDVDEWTGRLSSPEREKSTTRDPEYPDISDLDLDISVGRLIYKDAIITDLHTGLKAQATSIIKSSEGLPENINLQLDAHAGSIAYKNIHLGDLLLKMQYSDARISLEEFRSEFAGGMVSAHGNLVRGRSGLEPGYLYLETIDIDISEVLGSFNNFGQDKFTLNNSSGKISSASHHYFMLNKDLSVEADENLWLVNIMVHHAEFDQVEPIEKTLFFVGHKSKDTMMVSELDVSLVMGGEKLYFQDLVMNDNIANLELTGIVDLGAKEMDLAAEISLSDLFFRSRKERMLETQEGIVKLDSDARVFLKLYGPLNDHKLNLISKKKFFRFREDLNEEISGAEDDFRDSLAKDSE